MDVSEWVKTVAAIVTTASALTVVVTYVKKTLSDRRLAVTERATKLRARLQRIVAEVQSLQVELHQGTAIIAAAEAIADAIEARLEAGATAQDLVDVVADDRLMLSVAVNGWHRSRAGTEVTDRLRQIELEAAQLQGDLRVVTGIVDLLSAMVTDGCSPLQFYELLKHGAQPGPLRFALPPGLGPKRLIDEIKTTLQTHAATYYAARYEKASRAMLAFIETVCDALTRLEDATLLSLADRVVARKVEGATRTAALRQQLRELEPVLEAADRNALSALVDNIEVYISKEFASAEARRVVM